MQSAPTDAPVALGGPTSILPGLPVGEVRYPDYARLFEGGKLEMSFAVGFDEHGNHHFVQRALESALTASGLRPVSIRGTSAEALKKLGIEEPDAAYQYYARMTPQGEPQTVPNPVTGQPSLVTARVLLPHQDGLNDPEGAAKKGEALRRLIDTGTAVTYIGHARYGSGPDVDHIQSPNGNFRIGTPYSSGVVTLPVEQHITATALKNRNYQFFVFCACDTKNYLGPFRKAGMSTRDKDVLYTIIEPTFLQVATTPGRLIPGLLKGSSVNDLLSGMNEAAGGAVYSGDGFADNPKTLKIAGS
jgi:hypothetical protein